MAYHNREWDRGKDSWNDSSWQDTSRGNVRARDEEHHSDGGKRRKYNDGSSDITTTRAYQDSSHEHAYGQGQVYPIEQDTDDKFRSGGAFNKKRLVPSEGSPHVIFLGLDPDFTEADLQAYLLGHGCNIETVTIIRDRSTGVSKGFGFAQFTSTENARKFVDPLFPFIQVPPPASHGATAAAAFYKAIETGVPHNGRRVKIDYSQSASPHDRGRGGRTQQANDGTRDIGNSQAPVLLFRGLDPLSGPQAIYQAMKNSSGLGKEGAKGMRRIILIKDKMTLASWGFAFVEFVDVQSASAVLAATMSPQIHPSGFRISDRPVAASFAHPYSFQPIPEYSLRDDNCLDSSLGLGGVEGTAVRYWDEASMIAVLEFEVEQPAQSAPVQAAKDKKEKKKKESSIAAQEGPKEASVLPVSDKPVTLSFNKTGLSTNKPVATGASVAKSAPLKLGFSITDDTNVGEGLEEQDELSADMGDNKVAVAKKVPPLIASKKTANNINKWNQVQGELNHDAVPTAPVASTSIVVTVEKPKLIDVALSPEAEFEFSDIAGLTCLLCARQFKSMDQLKRHNKESDLHKKNYRDSNLKDIAREKVQIARAKSTAVDQGQQQPKYRDRASERRVMHNQPDAPVPVVEKSGKVTARRHVAGPTSGTPPPHAAAPVAAPGKDENNVGHKLLKMMGWAEGSGLGSNGEGRVDPIQTAMYAQGVGLGASKGKDIESLASGGYSGYQMAQETARERYNNS